MMRNKSKLAGKSVVINVVYMTKSSVLYTPLNAALSYHSSCHSSTQHSRRILRICETSASPATTCWIEATAECDTIRLLYVSFAYGEAKILSFNEKHNYHQPTLSRKMSLYCSNFDVHESILIIFGTNVTEKVSNKSCFISPPHLSSASALPGETENFGKCAL